MLDFRILGPFEVVEHGTSVPLGSPRQRALLAILLLHRGEQISTDRLIDLLWGERPPPTATKIVQGYVSHLCKILGEDTLITRGAGYGLVVEPEQIDAERFMRLVAEGRDALAACDAPAARERLAAALAMWRGEPLADFSYERFAEGEVARLGEWRLAALEGRIESDLSLGGLPSTRAVSDVTAGRADYAVDGEITPGQAPTPSRRLSHNRSEIEQCACICTAQSSCWPCSPERSLWRCTELRPGRAHASRSALSRRPGRAEQSRSGRGNHGHRDHRGCDP